jgi:glycine cleavage system pyridoxal-binding protein P
MYNQYKYKINWILKPKQAFKLFKIIGVRGFDKICLRDINLKILDTYTNFICYSFELAEEETIKYIKRQLKQNKNIYYVEVVRR